jgi:hypothetical protein
MSTHASLKSAMSAKPIHKLVYGWLEILLIISFATLLVQLFPDLLSYPWSILKSAFKNAVWVVDVRNWNWSAWLVAEGGVVALLLYLRARANAED